ncbi:MAG: tRNA uridine-5-carboxymethylaminomethyl(34) synthesis GTPase MnmE [Fimbriimonadaceae bacterium]|nr:tRNA uridine-5-carboxymethylaminomethyl(34) synthesis GTPase MnmE [Fimbriimonadaceae bacterium]
MPSLTDTIIAPITGSQPAAVAIVRLSGPLAWEIGSRVFEPWPKQVEERRAVYGKVSTGDDGLMLPFAEGKSYTGEQSVELQIHGSLASVQSLVGACIGQGARMADPGEFTQRAFLNGRIDLTQAEAVKDLIEARSEAQLRHAALIRDGALLEAVTKLSREVIGVLAAVEASVDFSEEVGPLNRTEASFKLVHVRSSIDRLLDTAHFGRILRQGLRIAIVGPPNAGKSSLLNALVGADRAIVTDIPGTTRDYVEEEVVLGGLPCVLIDTAGLRETNEQVEKIGVERSLKLSENADYVWYVYDASIGLEQLDRDFLAKLTRPHILIANKSDLEPMIEEGIALSATEQLGLEQLSGWARGLQTNAEQHSHIFINPRHEIHLERARAAITTALDTLDAEEIPDDLVAVGLQDAIQALGEITGETAGEDMIDRIFKDFCIGK